jgi:Tfp pilus assembly protein PilF
LHRLVIHPLFIVLLAFMLTACASADKKNQAETHYIMGVSFIQEQDATRALNEFIQAAELSPKDARIQAALAQSYQLRGAYPEAERHYLRALRLGGADPKVQNNLGSLYLDMQRWDDAIKQFRAASDSLVFTNQALALTGLGFAHAQKGENLEAVSAYQRALKENPRSVRANILLGEAYSQMDKPDLAIGAYRQALNLSPNNVVAHLQLALAYMKIGDRQKATESFGEILRLAPDSEQALRAAEFLKQL